MRKLILVLTVALLSVGSVRGLLAAKHREPYPCAFERLEGGRWAGRLSLRDAEQLRKKSARIGERISVRLVHVDRENVHSMIRCVARAYGMAPGPFFEVAECETHVTPDENLFQYIDSTWKTESAIYGHKGAEESDAYANIHVTVQWVRDGGWGPWTCQPG